MWSLHTPQTHMHLRWKDAPFKSVPHVKNFCEFSELCTETQSKHITPQGRSLLQDDNPLFNFMWRNPLFLSSRGGAVPFKRGKWQVEDGRLGHGVSDETRKELVRGPIDNWDHSSRSKGLINSTQHPPMQSLVNMLMRTWKNAAVVVRRNNATYEHARTPTCRTHMWHTLTEQTWLRWDLHAHNLQMY